MGRRSPQEKKALEYAKDHFTFGWNSSRLFPKAWKLKKVHVNRQYRRKSQELLADLKPGLGEADLIADDLTAAHFQKSIRRKHLYKQGTVTLGEKVRIKLEKRAARVERRTQFRQRNDSWALSTVTTLDGLRGGELLQVSRRAEALCSGNRRIASCDLVTGSRQSCAGIPLSHKFWLRARNRCAVPKP